MNNTLASLYEELPCTKLFDETALRSPYIPYKSSKKAYDRIHYPEEMQVTGLRRNHDACKEQPSTAMALGMHQVRPHRNYERMKKIGSYRGTKPLYKVVLWLTPRHLCLILLTFKLWPGYSTSCSNV